MDLTYIVMLLILQQWISFTPTGYLLKIATEINAR